VDDALTESLPGTEARLGFREISVGILSAFNVHGEGNRCIGDEVTFTDRGRAVHDEIKDMFSSDLSPVYYTLVVRGTPRSRAKVYHLSLSKKIHWKPKGAIPVTEEPKAPICAAIIDGKTCREPLHHDARKHERVVTPASRERMYGSLDPVASEPEFCSRGTCVEPINVMAFKGTGYCSTNCAKIARGEKVAVVVQPLSPAQVF